MIQNVSPIEKEFLLKTVIQNEHPVRFHGVSTTGTGLINTAERSMFSITLIETLNNSSFSVCERITGYFDCHGRTYAFESTVRELKNKQILIDPPVRLLKSLQRKFVRVRRPKDVKVLFHLANEEIQLDYPVCPEYISVDELPADRIGTFSGIPELIAQFKTDLCDTCSGNTITMFRTKKPEHYEETLISKTGKVLFIPSTSSSLPKSDPYPDGRIITERIEEQYEPPDYFLTGSRFEALLKDKKERGITSEIWCPIIYYQYVIGYIYVINAGGSFDISMVDYLWDFSRVLAYKLKASGYFDAEEVKNQPKKHEPKILDMSPGGMLISIPKNEIRMPIHEGSIFTLDIKLGPNMISCSAKVTRRYEETDSVSYGTSFLNLSPDNIMMIYEALYRKPFTMNDPLAYEQLIKALS